MENPIVPCAKPVGQDLIDGMLVKWTKEAIGYDPEYRSSLPMQTGDDRRGVWAIAESECVSGASLINTSFEVSDYICHECVLTSKKTGELIKAIRTIFLGPGHLPIHFVAQSALLFILRSARHRLSEPAWDPPLKVKLVQVPCGAGHTYKFRPVAPAKPSR